jgi:hypothetical protein
MSIQNLASYDRYQLLRDSSTGDLSVRRFERTADGKKRWIDLGEPSTELVALIKNGAKKGTVERVAERERQVESKYGPPMTWEAGGLESGPVTRYGKGGAQTTLHETGQQHWLATIRPNPGNEHLPALVDVRAISAAEVSSFRQSARDEAQRNRDEAKRRDSAMVSAMGDFLREPRSLAKYSTTPDSSVYALRLSFGYTYEPRAYASVFDRERFAAHNKLEFTRRATHGDREAARTLTREYGLKQEHVDALMRRFHSDYPREAGGYTAVTDLPRSF